MSFVNKVSKGASLLTQQMQMQLLLHAPLQMGLCVGLGVLRCWSLNLAVVIGHAEYEAHGDSPSSDAILRRKGSSDGQQTQNLHMHDAA